MGKMFKNKFDSNLLVKYLANDAGKDEIAIIENWLSKSHVNKEYFDQYKKMWEESKTAEKYRHIDIDKDWQIVSGKFKKSKEETTGKVRELKGFQYYFIRIAAAIIPPLIIMSVFFINRIQNDKDNIAVVVKNDVNPGTKKAILMLADETTIELSKEEIKQLATVDGTRISNEKSTLLYSGESEDKSVTPVYNTLITPLGGEYNLELSDGTKIWLNAGSSIKYPVRFNDTIRNVFLEGEAYFEVAENLEKPFIVSVSNVDIRVLGTAFNVMAYNDEEMLETTLAEGKVQIHIKDTIDSSTMILTPGYQASFSKETKTVEKYEVNVDKYISWKEGYFVFDNDDLTSIMRKLARWYDIDVEFNNNEIMNYHFSGKLKRYENISGILEMIGLTTNVQFEINDKKVIVKKV